MGCDWLSVAVCGVLSSVGGDSPGPCSSKLSAVRQNHSIKSNTQQVQLIVGPALLITHQSLGSCFPLWEE